MTRSRLSLFLVAALVWGVTSGSVAQETAEGIAEAAPAARADLSGANELVRAQDYAGAEAKLAALHAEFPDDPALLLMRGEVLLALGKPADAVPLLRRCAELEPERPRVHFDLGAALASTGDAAGAIEAFGRELAQDDVPAEVATNARLNRAMLLQQSRMWDAAATELEILIESEPGRLPLHGELTNAYIEAGRLDEAATALDRGLAAGFRSANHFYNLGARFYRTRAFGPAAATLRKAVEIDPQLASARRSLGAALEQLGRDDEAVQHLRRYLELRPNAPDAAQVRARIEASGR